MDSGNNLRTEQAMLRGMLNAATEESIWLFDRDGTILLANATSLKRIGRQAQQMIGKPLADFLSPELSDLGLARIRQVFDTGQPLQFEDLRDGSYFHHSLCPVADDSCSMLGVASFSRDITRQKLAEEALRTSEERYAKAFAINPAAIALTKFQDGIFLDVNDTWVSLMGYSREEALGQSARKLPIWPNVEAMARFTRQLAEQGFLRNWEEVFCKKSGETFRAQVSAQMLLVGGEQVILSTLIDITEKMRTQQRYEQQVRLFDGVAATTPDFVYLFDTQGRFLYANNRLLEVLGMQLPDVVGKTCLELGYQKWHHDMHLGEIAQVIDTRRPIKGEVPFEAPLTGVFGIYEYIFTPVLGPDGEVELIAGTTRDVTERKRAEQELRKAHDLLEERVKERTALLESALHDLQEKEHLLLQQSRMAAMGEMLSNISHQWRQPLNLLGITIQNLELVQEEGGVTEEDVRETVEKSMELIRYMSRTIDDFRNFFQPDKEKTSFRLSEVVTAATKLMEGAFRNKEVSLEIEQLSDPEVYGYPGECSQVVVNILSNAKEAFASRRVSDARVLVILDEQDGRSRLTIRDNAGGIDTSIIAKVFEPHFTTKGAQGTGIGLFMSKNIIEKNMHGSLTVRNTATGAEFLIQV